ncbi:major capsid protein [Streptomyces sp. NPDC048361]|uniref:major capsid protein n=1 Tax=Streptomyces sp. NPDC048361 TaxID=3154720 RepID=UPI00342283CA
MRLTDARPSNSAGRAHFADQFFNGDVEVNPKGFDGLRKRLLGGQVLDAKGVGPVANGHDLFDVLDALVAQVRGLNGTNGALYMNAALRAKIESGFRRLGGAELLSAAIAGKRTTTWKGIPLLDAGQKLDGTDVLPMTAGTGAKQTGDIYAVRFGSTEADAGVTGLTNGVCRPLTWASLTTSLCIAPGSTSIAVSRCSAGRPLHA